MLPSNFGGTIVLKRQRVQSLRYADTTQGSTLVESLPSADDTSDPSLRDDNPQSGGSAGKVYDLDAPGLGSGSTNPIGMIQRRRTNFTEWATVDGMTTRVSSDFTWFSRISIIKTASGDQLRTDVTGDNLAGVGVSPVTWNLQ